MAGKGTASSFTDSLQALVQEVAKLLASPDADRQWVMSLIDAIHQKLGAGQGQPGVGQPGQPSGAGAAGSPPTAAGPPPGMDTGAGGPGSQPSAQPDLSRGPTPGPDMGSMTGELRRMMAGR